MRLSLLFHIPYCPVYFSIYDKKDFVSFKGSPYSRDNGKLRLIYSFVQPLRVNTRPILASFTTQLYLYSGEPYSTAHHILHSPTMTSNFACIKASAFPPFSPQHNTPTHNSYTRTETDSVSPTKQRTQKWLQEHTPKKHGSGLELRKVKEGGIARKGGRDQRKKRASFWDMTLWFSRFGVGQSDDREGDDLEGDTMIDDDGSAVALGYDNDSTLVVDDYDEGIKGDETARVLRKIPDRHHDYGEARMQDWTEGERWLFTKLANRGHEPLLHNTWIMDYPHFPDQLFTNDENRVYISNIHSSIGRGTQSPSALPRLRRS